MFTPARRRGHTLADLVGWLSRRPAELIGLARRKGRLALGCDADLVVFDPDAEFTVRPELPPCALSGVCIISP